MGIFVCENCGWVAVKWLGRCPGCGQWNTFTEKAPAEEKVKRKGSGEEPVNPSKILEAGDERRISTGIGEFDRVLGGGIVEGEVVLIAGEPGIGKSTLLLQTALNASEEHKVLYVSSEESVGQIALRLRRIAKNFKDENILLLFENSAERVFEIAEREGVKLLFLDAIQSFWSDELESPAGSPSQVRQVCALAVDFAKSKGASVFLVGHVTKEGVVAGPKVVEHMVDAVLYFESEGMWRVLRATKNRFGSTGEVGIFVMTERGLEEISDPSTAFLQKHPKPKPGSVITAVLEGTRIYLVEVQALVSKTQFSVPRRSAQGYDVVRLNTLVAVLEKICGLELWDKDIYLNVAGGIRVSDVCADLAVVLAVASSFAGKPLPFAVAFGEVGLLGEIRPSSFAEERVQQSKRISPELVICGPVEGKNEELFAGVRSFSDVKDAIEFAVFGISAV